MPRKRTSRIKKQVAGPRQVNLRVNTRQAIWCRTKKNSLRLCKVAFCLAVGIAALAGGKIAMQRMFLDTNEFALNQVELWQWESDVAPRLINHQRLQRVTGLKPGASIFEFQLNEIEETIAELPEIKEVRATRRLPGVLRIRVREREPVAWVDSPRQGLIGRDYQRGLLVDGEGFCFAPARAMAAVTDHLPVITTAMRGQDNFQPGEKAKGREFLRALNLVQISDRHLAEAGWSLPAVSLCNDYSLIAKTHTGAVVTFGLYEHERQLEDLLLILGHARKTSRGVERVNLIPERNIPVVFASENGIHAPSNSRLESNLDAILTRS
jgi:hypothetical protein